MHASINSTPARGLREWWADPPRSGLRRMISPVEYRNLRPWAGAHLASAAVLIGLGVVTFAFGGNDWKTFGFAMMFLAGAAAHLAVAGWELSIARSQPPRT